MARALLVEPANRLENKIAVGVRGRVMKLAFIIALILATSPVAAQVTTSNQQQQPLAAGGQIVTSPLTNTGVICQEEMVATFCNAPTGPNLSGSSSSSAFVGSNAASGSGTGVASPSAGNGTTGPTGAAAPSPAIPTCPEIPLATEFCD